MNLPRSTLLTVIVVPLAVLVAYLILPKEPTHQGKRLRYWTVRLEFADFETRSNATVAVQTMGEAAVPTLIKMLQTKDSRPNQAIFDLTRDVPFPLDWRLARRDRLEAAVALGVLGPKAREAVPALLEACRETNSLVSTKAEAALIRIRQESILPLLAKLSNFSATNWRQTATIISDLGSNAAPAIPVLLEALQHTNHLIRYFAASCLGHLALAPEQVVPALMRSAFDSQASVRMQSLLALYEFGQNARPAATVMLQSLQDSHVHVRLNALLALSAIVPVPDPNQAVVAVTRALNDAEPAVRVAATNLLRQINPGR